MSTLLCNIPPIKVWVRKEYLYDLRKGHGEYTPGYWVTCKTLTGRALYMETYLPEYAACFDKLPISAFLIWESDHPTEPRKPEPDLPLTDLQYWNGFDQAITCIEKNLLFNMDFTVRTRENGSLHGSYLFTLDNYHSDRNEPDYYFAEDPSEHKSHNIIALSNGQIGAYPNNRCQMSDPSLTPETLKRPDFLVSTRYFDVESAPKWGRLGSCEEYMWETDTEKKQKIEIQQDVEKLNLPDGVSLEPFAPNPPYPHEGH